MFRGHADASATTNYSLCALLGKEALEDSFFFLCRKAVLPDASPQDDDDDAAAAALLSLFPE